ncbi:MAG TPA: LysE family transporter [Cyclobacteriaceae bacterium]|jgi:threonine/homoserine/homoserine lactone efflux protein
MEAITLFTIGLFFSYIGSIPPGSINISVLQLSMGGHRAAAVRFTLVAAVIEFVYAYIAVKFQQLILSSQMLQDNFKLIAAVVLIILGLLSLRSGSGQKRWEKKLESSGLRKGLMVSVANPLAIPFWIAITAYLETNNWISLNSSNEFIYIAGIAAGTIALLFTLVFLGSKASRFMTNQERAKKIPGFVLLGLGIYSLVQLLIEVVTR